jgi:hypothetical protein
MKRRNSRSTMKEKGLHNSTAKKQQSKSKIQREVKPDSGRNYILDVSS